MVVYINGLMVWERQENRVICYMFFTTQKGGIKKQASTSLVSPTSICSCYSNASLFKSLSLSMSSTYLCLSRPVSSFSSLSPLCSPIMVSFTSTCKLSSSPSWLRTCLCGELSLLLQFIHLHPEPQGKSLFLQPHLLVWQPYLHAHPVSSRSTLCRTACYPYYPSQ